MKTYIQQILIVMFSEGPRSKNATPGKIKSTFVKYKFAYVMSYFGSPVLYDIQ